MPTAHSCGEVEITHQLSGRELGGGGEFFGWVFSTSGQWSFALLQKFVDKLEVLLPLLITVVWAILL